jgi:hypothetical protein
MQVTMDGPNLRLELTHEETDSLLKAMTGGVPAISALLTAAGVPVFAVGIAAGALALHAAWEGAAIKAADKGEGVFLTSPTVPLGPIGFLFIPTTRHSIDNEGWSTKPESTIGSTEGDLIATQIADGGDPKTVVFRLVNQTSLCWNKAIVLRDGTGGEFWIEAHGCGTAENGLWSEQVKNGQVITFWKPKFAGQWQPIFNLGGLERLQPGSVVTFTWKSD